MINLFFVLLFFLGPGCDFSGTGLGNFGQGFGFFSGQPWFLDDLNLPPDLMEKVQNLHLQHREKMIDLQANLQKQNLKFQQILINPDLTEKELLQELDKISELRNNLIKEKAIFLFNLKKILPPEEWDKLRDQFFEKRPGGKFFKKGGRYFDDDFSGRGSRRQR